MDYDYLYKFTEFNAGFLQMRWVMHGIERIINRMEVIADEMDYLLSKNPKLSYNPKPKYRPALFYNDEDRERDDYNERRMISEAIALTNEAGALLREAIKYFERAGMRKVRQEFENLEGKIVGKNATPRNSAHFLRMCVGSLRGLYYQMND